jgi:hypothetical protein
MKEFPESMIHPNERREKSIQTWMNAYNVTLKSDKKLRARLRELETWDTCNDNAYEHSVKVEALQRLIG